MIKQILVVGILFIGLSGIVNATPYETHSSNMDGDGALHYPNKGWITHYVFDDKSSGSSTKGHHQFSYTHPSSLAFNLNVSGYGSMTEIEGNIYEHSNHLQYYRGSTAYYIQPCGYSPTVSYSGLLSGAATPTSGKYVIFEIVANTGSLSIASARQSLYISPYIIQKYNVSGSIECLDNVTLYADINNTWEYISFNNSDSYLFQVIDGETYKLIFNDDHEYEFTVDGSDITYDHDGCTHTTYRFEESCGNLIPDSEGIYVEWLGGSWLGITPFYEPSGILDISNSSASAITVESQTFIGNTRWGFDPIVSGTTYVLQNPNIAWRLKVIVQNESDGSLIDGAMVKVAQDCYCTSGYSTRQKLTVNGMSQFGEMSLQDASLFVMKYGYKILDENTTGYSAFLSGRSNFSSKTWIVKLAASTSNNSSTFYETTNKVDIHFRDVNGNRTSKILDTDSEVYLYYENNNSEEEAMTLKFQSSSTHTHFIDVQSWNIPYDEIGHKTILQTDFTPYDYSYRAVIYNSSIYGWNKTIPLTVRNATKEDEQHYENLTTNLWFMYTDAGKVDYRDGMKVAIHAQSNNTTLMTIDVELWVDGVYTDCENLTVTDFINADFPYYYVWNPDFDYVSGSNYSIRMYGFDRTLLETDYVECITDNVTRKNKLTIIVKNQAGIILDNAFVYLEEYGSIATGTNYYTSFEGLDNGYYRFKATKPDYTGTGWGDITISDNDETVTYTLTWSGSGEGGAMQQQKMGDADMSNIYLMLMAIVLIFIIFGAFKYAM